LQVHIRDVAQHQGAAVGLFEPTVGDALAVFGAEQFGGGMLGRQRTDGDFNKRTVTQRAVRMDVTRNDLLA